MTLVAVDYGALVSEGIDDAGAGRANMRWVRRFPGGLDVIVWDLAAA
jgi:hypothetical protein